MAYVKTSNGTVVKYPYSIGELRKDNPNTSFPKHITADMLADHGVFQVSIQSPESFDERTQKIAVASEPTLVNGSWALVQSAASKTDQEIADYDQGIAKSVRKQRDAKLAETDYLALSDNTLTEAMATYRQALRDITEHANFPHLEDSDWPVKP